GPPRRVDGRPRRLVVQPAAVEHRTTAAAEPRGGHRRGCRHARGRGPGDHGKLTHMALDPQLLDILACPEDKGPLLYFESEDALYNPRLKRKYAIKDDIPIMLIDEAETVDDAEHQRLLAKADAEGIKPTFDPSASG